MLKLDLLGPPRRLGPYYVGELPKPVNIEVNNWLGNDEDLTGATSVGEYRIGTNPVVSLTGALVDGPTGILQLVWPEAFAYEGTLRGWIDYIIGGEKQMGLEFIARIKAPPTRDSL